MRVFIIAILYICTAADIFAQDYTTVVQRAFEPIEQSSEEDWSFTETYTSEGVTRISQFDPRRPNGERWIMISLGGQPPTAKENEEFMRNRTESDDSGMAGDKFGYGFVTPDSLELIEETDTRYRFSFSPIVADDSEDAEIFRHVNGILNIDKRARVVESIELGSTQSFKPKMGVRIDSVDISIKFGQISEDGKIGLLNLTARVQGCAYLMLCFDEIEQVDYSNYARHLPTRVR